MLSRLIERILIKILKGLKINILSHAHVQMGVGHNTYCSGESFVIEKIIRRVLGKEPAKIFDVGANTGEYTKLLAATFPSAAIYCFEPLPANYEVLKLNTKGLNTINILSALGSQTGTIKLYSGENNTDGSMATSYKETLQTIFPFVGNIDTSVNCSVDTLDNFCESLIDIIDFLKIDVEGHELEVLKGAKVLIATNKINIIQFEFNEFNIFSKSFMYDFYKLLTSYDFYRIHPQNKLVPMGGYNSELEIFRYQNIIAVHKSLNFVYIDK